MRESTPWIRWTHWCAPTRYYYSVSATNAAGEGARSNEVNAVPVAPTVPSQPTLTRANQVGTIQLTWTSSSSGGRPISGYNLYRSTSAAGPYTQIAANLPTGSYQDTTVIIATTYYYEATSVNSVGESPQSSSVSGVASAYSGSGSYTTTPCAAGASCTSPTVSDVDGAGNTTTANISSETSSASAHTLTAAVGGTPLSGCTVPAAGLGVVFNDTSNDSYKKVVWRLNGSDADVWNAYYSPTPGYEGCLGLGTPWFAGSPSNPAIWNAADGLYEAAPPLCVNNGAYSLGGGLYSQPCTDLLYQPSGPVATHYRQYTFHLPPGDGKIGGGTCC